MKLIKRVPKSVAIAAGVVLGTVVALTGLYRLTNLDWTLLVAGLLVAAVCALVDF